MVRIVWLALGVVLLLAGGGITLTAHSAADFGWFAYTPLDNGVHLAGNAVILTRTQLIGPGVSLVGLALLACWLGYVAGQRRRG